MEFGVPDTIDGRFDLLTLHAFMVLEKLKIVPLEGEAIAKELVTVIFTGFDEALRDLGIGDFGIAHRIKKMANAFYGRLESYSAAVPIVPEILLRNVYRNASGSPENAALLCRYVEQTRASLRTEDLLAGKLNFGPLVSRM